MARESNINQECTSTTAKDQEAKALDYLFDEEELSESFERSASLLDQQNIKELESYLQQPTLPRNEDPLLWWNSHKRKFPTLARIARKFLAIPAYSTPSERVFSTAENIVSTKRSSLLPENANVLIFLYQNRNLIE